ncbi:MAG: type II toxin-antitoxin system RelE/ParE family toxin [Planctomycetales bacterium]|nr:type II toxin-antitoxin system RelE/ParE family toxin [Planctomycetales bacterium]
MYAANQLAGEARPDIGDNVRVFSFERWVVFFRPIDEGIEVLSVVDGARDYRDHLRRR